MKTIKSARQTLGLVFAVMISVPCSASLIYNIDHTIGTAGSVVGSITTDGTLGPLSSASIEAFFLTIGEGGETAILSSALGHAIHFDPDPSGFTAAADSLSYDFGVSGFGHFQIINDNAQNFWCYANTAHCGSSGNYEAVRVGATGLETNSGLSGKVLVGAVPEPASLALFGLGLAGLGWSRRNKV